MKTEKKVYALILAFEKELVKSSDVLARAHANPNEYLLKATVSPIMGTVEVDICIRKGNEQNTTYSYYYPLNTNVRAMFKQNVSTLIEQYETALSSLPTMRKIWDGQTNLQPIGG
jgi:hypothetical protein